MNINATVLIDHLNDHSESRPLDTVYQAVLYPRNLDKNIEIYKNQHWILRTRPDRSICPFFHIWIAEHVPSFIFTMQHMYRISYFNSKIICLFFKHCDIFIQLYKKLLNVKLPSLKTISWTKLDNKQNYCLNLFG